MACKGYERRVCPPGTIYVHQNVHPGAWLPDPLGVVWLPEADMYGRRSRKENVNSGKSVQYPSLEIGSTMKQRGRVPFVNFPSVVPTLQTTGRKSGYEQGFDRKREWTPPAFLPGNQETNTIRGRWGWRAAAESMAVNTQMPKRLKNHGEQFSAHNCSLAPQRRGQIRQDAFAPDSHLSCKNATAKSTRHEEHKQKWGNRKSSRKSRARNCRRVPPPVPAAPLGSTKWHYRGISWNQALGLWTAYLYDPENKKTVYLGTRKSQQEAAILHDWGMRLLQGCEAVTNFPKSAFQPSFHELKQVKDRLVAAKSVSEDLASTRMQMMLHGEESCVDVRAGPWTAQGPEEVEILRRPPTAAAERDQRHIGNLCPDTGAPFDPMGTCRNRQAHPKSDVDWFGTVYGGGNYVFPDAPNAGGDGIDVCLASGFSQYPNQILSPSLHAHRQETPTTPLIDSNGHWPLSGPSAGVGVNVIESGPQQGRYLISVDMDRQGRLLPIGYAPTAMQAAQVHDMVVLALHGTWARLNFPPSTYHLDTLNSVLTALPHLFPPHMRWMGTANATAGGVENRCNLQESEIRKSGHNHLTTFPPKSQCTRATLSNACHPFQWNKCKQVVDRRGSEGRPATQPGASNQGEGTSAPRNVLTPSPRSPSSPYNSCSGAGESQSASGERPSWRETIKVPRLQDSCSGGVEKQSGSSCDGGSCRSQNGTEHPIDEILLAAETLSKMGSSSNGSGGKEGKDKAESGNHEANLSGAGASIGAAMLRSTPKPVREGDMWLVPTSRQITLRELIGGEHATNNSTETSSGKENEGNHSNHSLVGAGGVTRKGRLVRKPKRFEEAFSGIGDGAIDWEHSGSGTHERTGSNTSLWGSLTQRL